MSKSRPQPSATVSLRMYVLVVIAVRKNLSKVDNSSYSMLDDVLAAINDAGYGMRYGGKNGGDDFTWNGLIPVAISLNGDLDVQTPVGGVDFSAGGTLILRGKDQWDVIFTLDSGVPNAFGLNASVGVEAYVWFYTGDISHFTSHDFNGSRREIEFGFGNWGAGLTVSERPDEAGNRLIGLKVEYQLIPIADFLPKITGGYNRGDIDHDSGTQVIY